MLGLLPTGTSIRANRTSVHTPSFLAGKTCNVASRTFNNYFTETAWQLSGPAPGAFLSMGKQRNSTDHCPVHAAFSSVRIKELIMANSTEIHCRDRGCRHTLPLHLSSDQGLEIESSLVSSITPHD